MSCANFYLNNNAFKNLCYFSDGGDNEDSYLDYRDMIDNFNYELKNQNFDFFELSIKDGYFDGIQIVIDSAVDGLADYHLIESDFNNEESQYYFNLCRSKAVRKIKSEIKKINKFLDFLKFYGFKEFAQIAQFDNGETLYKLEG